jgi:hypothetical protein
VHEFVEQRHGKRSVAEVVYTEISHLTSFS